MKLTKEQKQVVARYASNGWNSGLCTNELFNPAVYADAKGFEKEAKEAYLLAYEEAKVQAVKQGWKKA